MYKSWNVVAQLQWHFQECLTERHRFEWIGARHRRFNFPWSEAMQSVMSTDNGKVGGRFTKDSDSDCYAYIRELRIRKVRRNSVVPWVSVDYWVKIPKRETVSADYSLFLSLIIHDSRPSSYLSRSRFLGVPRCEWWVDRERYVHRYHLITGSSHTCGRIVTATDFIAHVNNAVTGK